LSTALWSQLFLAATTVGIGWVAWRLRAEAVQARREHAIRELVFEGRLFDKLREKHPQLTLKDCQLVARGLRQFFLAYLKLGRRGALAMPSRVVDDLWHEFILDTRRYARFCDQAFGHYFHHLPAGSASGAHAGEAGPGLRGVWRLVCLEENINPSRPTRMPLLFALDDKLKIQGGRHFALPRHRPGGSGPAASYLGSSGSAGSSNTADTTTFACSGSGLIGGQRGGDGAGHDGASHDGGGRGSGDNDAGSSDAGSACSGGSSCSGGGGCGGGGGD